MPKTLEAVVDLQGTKPDDRIYAFDFSNFDEILAGATIASAVVECSPTTNITVGAPVVVGSQVQVEISPALAAVGTTYAFSCSATLSTGRVIVRRGRLVVTGSS